MPRYKLDIAYDGQGFHGFQAQPNAITIEGTIENTLHTYFRTTIDISGSSRTDRGVHALDNTAHFDYAGRITDKDIYHLNSILPEGIVINEITEVADDFHARFDAKFRSYDYYIHTYKDPIRRAYSYFFPYRLDTAQLHETAALVLEYTDFSSFSKKNTDVFHYECHLMKSEWLIAGHVLHYHVQSNRFLRGMVRGLVASQLAVARGHMTMEEFISLLEHPEISTANFSSPAQGLFLSKVGYD